ncbi:MAG TPA: terminase [Gammaproteobacteria bacterium]|nr:terminase [Gammaproteobacteria bacterium]
MGEMEDRSSERTSRARGIFIDALGQSANISHACRASGISRTQAYSLKEKDPAFAEEWETALDQAVDRLEQEAWRRAVEGYQETTESGDRVSITHRYSDRMLEILLKGHRPERFVEKRQIEHSGPNGGPIKTVDMSKLTDEQIMALASIDPDAA